MLGCATLLPWNGVYQHLFSWPVTWSYTVEFLPSIDYRHLILLISFGRVTIASNVCILLDHHVHRVHRICTSPCYGDFETGWDLNIFMVSISP